MLMIEVAISKNKVIFGGSRHKISNLAVSRSATTYLVVVVPSLGSSEGAA